MAVRTSAQSGLWSATSTWVGGVVPGNLDTVVISTGHVVEFDVDQSGFANGIGPNSNALAITLNGTLRASTTPGDYVLKLCGQIVPGASGRLEAGTAVTPYPANCTFEIKQAIDAHALKGGTDAVWLYCQQPATEWVKTTADYSAGATVLAVDTDVTGDKWAIGDTVVVCNVNKGQNYEMHTIAGISAGAITLAAPLASAKITGTVIVLSTRNVRLIGPGSTGRGQDQGAGGEYRCEIRAFSLAINNYSGIPSVISGPISGCSTGVNSGAGHVISGPISGCSNGVNYGTSLVISGSISGCSTGVNSGTSLVISGSISGCSTGVYAGTGHVISGPISGCSNGVIGGTGRIISSTFNGNTYDLRETVGVAIGSSFNSTTQNYNYASSPTGQFVAWDIGGVHAAVKAWMGGGTIVPEAVVVPTGWTASHRIQHERAAAGAIATPVWLDYPLLNDGRALTKATVWLRRDTASMTELPRVQLIAPDEDPIIISGASPLWEQVMTAGVDTWELVNVSFAADRLRPGTVLRVYSRNASGNVYFQVRTEPPPILHDSVGVSVTSAVVMLEVLP